jgi:alpha-galactosidase
MASILLSDPLFPDGQKRDDVGFPDEVTAILNDQSVKLSSESMSSWTYNDLRVELEKGNRGLVVTIEAPQSSLSEVTLFWKRARHHSSSIMNDHWERTYGDASWHAPAESEILPWYFMEYDGTETSGFGVKTGSAAFCFWQAGGERLSMSMDTRSGGNGVRLGGRRVQVAEIVTTKSRPGESPFQTTRRFARMMCDKARMPKQPVYGINDWYFAYGNNSEELILEHTKTMAPLADDLDNRPFSVIDAGWFIGSPSSPNDCSWGDRMDLSNSRFGDMGRLAGRIRAAGMRPGIWTRPLCGSHRDPQSLMLPLVRGREEQRPVLDPTIPENLERIRNYLALYNEWSFEIVKFDFTAFDIFGKWGFEMLRDRSMSSPNWRMHDNSRTNAEIILSLYRAIREAAGETYVIGCNTFSHLSAGLFELNRIGDDTSGNEWQRTRKMGVNTLAFRGWQHGIFYAADADCVGLTTKIPWQKNRQWMELVARSGTPLFISAQPAAMETPQKVLTKECFRIAARDLPIGEPLDWMENAIPRKWRMQGEVMTFDWD